MKNGNKLPTEFMADFTRVWTEVRFCARMLSLGKAYIVKGKRNGKTVRYTRMKRGYDYAGLDTEDL